ncbi:hypothetical protein C8Q77DRAFT_294450 [Trametes polyzona]|nr:hypothetical protein C8Q77DRAFT_294450 [Trametes polyzona]
MSFSAVAGGHSRVYVEISELEIAYIGNKQTPFITLLLYTSTLIFILGIIGVLNVRKPARAIATTDSPPRNSPPRRRLTHTRPAMPGAVMETWTLTLHWLCSVVASVVYFSFQSLDPHHLRAIGFVGCLVGIHTACREYDKLVQEDVIVFFTPLKFYRAWLLSRREYVSNVHRTKRRRRITYLFLYPSAGSPPDRRPSFDDSSLSVPSRLVVDTVNVDITRDPHRVAEVFELKTFSRDEGSKSPGDGALTTVTEEGSCSVLSSSACAYSPPEVGMRPNGLGAREGALCREDMER